MKRVLFIAAVAAGITGFTAWSVQGADGAALFKSKMCGACHAAGKVGGDFAAKSLTKEAIIKQLTGTTHKGPKNLSAEDAGALADYVLTLKK